MRFVPILVIASVAGLVFASGLHRQLSLDTLQTHYETLTAFVDARFWVALAAFSGLYIAAASLSLPGASLLSILGGFLFGVPIGFASVLVSATIGASIVFIAAKTAFGDVLKAKASGFVQRMEEGFNNNAVSYLLLLRLLPIFPFFVVNVAPAFFGVPTRVFVLTTFIGIIPGVFAYVSAGNGLGAVLEAGGELSLQGLLLQPEILTPIIALSVLALLPIVAKAFGIGKTEPSASDA
ncbi:MAG: VTT domain-containing protein [Pseudomonadota bacterium]